MRAGARARRLMDEYKTVCRERSATLSRRRTATWQMAVDERRKLYGGRTFARIRSVQCRRLRAGCTLGRRPRARRLATPGPSSRTLTWWWPWSSSWSSWRLYELQKNGVLSGVAAAGLCSAELAGNRRETGARNQHRVPQAMIGGRAAHIFIKATQIAGSSNARSSTLIADRRRTRCTLRRATQRNFKISNDHDAPNPSLFMHTTALAGKQEKQPPHRALTACWPPSRPRSAPAAAPGAPPSPAPAACA